MTYPGQCDDCPGRSSPLCCWEHHHPSKNNSEVARLMQSITAEYEAAQNAMHGFASGTAQHSFINARMERMDTLRCELAREVGDSEAMTIICNALLGSEEAQ